MRTLPSPRKRRCLVAFPRERSLPEISDGLALRHLESHHAELGESRFCSRFWLDPRSAANVHERV